MNLQETYSGTTPQFQAAVERLAEQSGKTALAVFAFWERYRAANPLLGFPEFEEWYKAELAPEIAARVREYEQARADKAERFAECAENAERRAAQAFDRADLREEKSGIPLGQPILVGHHSERRHRKALERADNAMRKGIEEREKAKYYERRADNAANGTAIMSSDPLADTKLAKEIAEAEQLQEIMKACNAAIRKHSTPEAQIAALVAIGRTEAQARKLIQPDFCGRIGFASYQLSNNNANIRRMKQRLERVAVAQATPETSIEGANARLEDCPADNRVRLFFPGKPSEEIRSRLKSAGFRWSPTIGAWQAFRNWRAMEAAKREAGIGQESVAAESERTAEYVDDVCPDGPSCTDPVCQEERRKLEKGELAQEIFNDDQAAPLADRKAVQS